MWMPHQGMNRENVSGFAFHTKAEFFTKNDDHLIKSKIQNEHFLGDILIWNDKTFHYGSENKSRSIRKYLFLIFTTNQLMEWDLRLNINSGIEILSVIKNY